MTVILSYEEACTSGLISNISNYWLLSAPVCDFFSKISMCVFLKF